MKSDEELFDISRSRIRASKEELLADNKAFAKVKKGENITRTAYTKWKGRRYAGDTIVRMFGSFAKACEEADVEYQIKHQYSDEELIRHFEDVWRWRGQRPVKQDFKAYNLEKGTTISLSTYERRWEWANFVRLFASFKLNQITYEQLISSKKQKNLRVPISARLRAEILQRDNYCCSDCGATPRKDPNVELQVHHIIPVSMGGKTIATNLTANFRVCNSGKSDKILSG